METSSNQVLAIALSVLYHLKKLIQLESLFFFVRRAFEKKTNSLGKIERNDNPTNHQGFFFVEFEFRSSKGRVKQSHRPAKACLKSFKEMITHRSVLNILGRVLLLAINPKFE